MKYPVFKSYYELREAGYQSDPSLGDFVLYFLTKWVPAYARSANWTDVPLDDFHARAAGLVTLFIILMPITLTFFLFALRNRNFAFESFALASILYLAILVYRNYSLFLEIQVTGAHQFRYLLPLFFPFLSLAILGVDEWLAERRLARDAFWAISPFLTVAVDLLFSGYAAFGI